MSDTTNYNFSTGPFEDLTSPGPGSVEAYDNAAGQGPGQCLKDAIQNEIFRGHIPYFWSEFTPKAEAQFGLAREVDADATAKAKARAKEGATINDVLEKPTAWIKRLKASLPDFAPVVALARSVASSLAIDPSPSRRASGPGKAFLEKADSMLALDDEQLEAKVSKLLATVEGFDLTRDGDGRPTRDSLAALVKAFFDAMA